MGLLKRIENGETTVRDAQEAKGKGMGLLLIGIGIGMVIITIAFYVLGG